MLDWSMIALYFLATAAVAWWSSRKQKSAQDYFLAGRNISFWVVGASLFATNIGSEHIVGLAGSGAKSGVAMAHYELHAWCILVLGWVFVPFYHRTGVFTMPEFLERRYNPASRWILTLVSLTAYVFTKVSVTVYAGAVVFDALLEPGTFGTLDNFWVGAFTVVILTGIYTVAGGLKAVVYTDALQALVLIIGSVLVTVIGLGKIGGWGQLHEICGSEFFNLWKPANDPDFPWPGMLFAAPIVGLWYWCTDQYIVQRTLAAKDETHARRGTIFAAYLKMLPLFIFIVPGMIAFALSKTGQLDLPKTDMAFPALVKALLPSGIRGIVVGGLLAALMSSLASLFNSCSTLFTIDIYEKIRPRASQKEMVTVGRIATAAVVVLGIIWIPVMRHVSGALYEYLQSVQAYLGPPITAVFFLGIFIKRVNGPGAVVGLLVGFALGLTKLTVQILASLEGANATMPLWMIEFGKINFLYFCVILFFITVVLVVGVSLLTAAPAPERLKGLSYATVTGEQREASRSSWNKWDVLATGFVLFMILSIYLYFTG